MHNWEISPKKLCRAHLLGEHRELHAIWSVLVNGKKGYAQHPETLRWKGKLKALYGRHAALVVEMSSRGYQHRSPLAKREATGSAKETNYVDTPKRQIVILRNKGCQSDV
jgi:hypothetical protein